MPGSVFLFYFNGFRYCGIMFVLEPKKAYIVHKATVHYCCSVVANFIQSFHIYKKVFSCLVFILMYFQKYMRVRNIYAYIMIYYASLCLLLYIIHVCVRNWYTSEMYACQKYIYVRNISMSEINACQKHVHVRNICM